MIDGEIDCLLHVCNNKGVMGSGIALEIKNRIPDAYTAYKYEDCILGVVTQGKRHLNYGALAECLFEIYAEFPASKVIGIPFKMGADRAGGDWNIVLELVEYFLKDFNVIVYEL